MQHSSNLLFRLSPHDAEGGFAPRDGARVASRDPRRVAVCAVDKQSGSLGWGLLLPVGSLLVMTDPELSPQVRVTVPPGDTDSAGSWTTV